MAIKAAATGHAPNPETSASATPTAPSSASSAPAVRSRPLQRF